MNEPFFRMMFFVGMNLCVFGGVYLYGYKAHPQLAAWLCIITCALLITLCFFNGAWMGLTVILPLIYLFVLRKPSQKMAFQEFYAEHKIFSVQKFSPAALEVLGNKNWKYAEGTLQKSLTEKITYGFWQGHTTSMVSAGQYTRTTVYTYYLAFVFPPGSVSNAFKQIAMAAADKSQYTFRQKLKYFFVLNTETPNLVTTAADGSFIIQYTVKLDIANYIRRMEWLKENIGKMYFASSGLRAVNNHN